MNPRPLSAALALVALLAAPALFAQNAAPAAQRATTATAPAAPSAPAATAARAPSSAPAATTARAPSPAPSRRSPAAPEPDLATAAAQVLNGVTGVLNGAQAPAPSAQRDRDEPAAQPFPTELLRSAGLDPARLPGVLGPFLRSDAGRRAQLSAPQLRQLGQLARRNLSARQLESVATAFSRAEHDEGEEAPVLSTRELNRVAQLAQRGASSASLLRSVSSMLQSE